MARTLLLVLLCVSTPIRAADQGEGSSEHGISSESETLLGVRRALDLHVLRLEEKLAKQEEVLARLTSKQSIVPDEYPYVLLIVGAGFFVTSMLMGGPVMSARKTYNVQYPNLYATPGFHKDADAFNRIQRGHQNMFETMTNVIVMVLVGGLAHPRIASALGAFYCIGSYGYLKGYSNLEKDVKGARYTHPLAILKPVGLLGSMVLSLITCYTMLAH